MKKNNQQKNKSRLSIILAYGLSGLLSIIMIVALLVTNMYSGLISTVLDSATTKIINPVDDIYTSDYESYEALVSAQEKIGQQVEAEGIVLLKNEDNTLPFNSEIKKITVFGQDSVDFVYGGSGSGSINASKAISLKTALETAGFSVNPTLWDFYLTGAGKDFRKTFPSETGAGEFAVNEVPADLYSDELKNSFNDYHDAAIVVIGRSGGESADLPVEPLKNGYRYLELDQNEIDMLNMAINSFDKVVVVINASNAMELGFLETMDVDACIWTGAVGQTGILAIGDVLNGTTNPSGRLVDTYAYNSTTAPSFVNMGDSTLTNQSLTVDDRNNKYLVYAEGIYIGYRYYETRYEDIVTKRENTGDFEYFAQVQFPFGYGLSYTSFSHGDYALAENEDSFEAQITVTNTGSVAGKDVVQIYMQSPYTAYDEAHQIEKSAIELVGFAKTEILEPGQSETLKINISKEWMKTYDVDGEGTYIVDAGDYYFAEGSNAHDALNNVLAAKGFTQTDGMTKDGLSELVHKIVVEEQDSDRFANSVATGNQINNEFADVDIKTYDNEFTYLSRKNWVETWPQAYQDHEWKAPEALVANLDFNREDAVIADGSSMPVTGKVPDEFVYVSDMIGKSYADPMWDSLLDELTIANMTKLVRMGGYATIPLDIIGLPSTADKDGPSGFSSSLIPGRSGMAYPTEAVMAATWNTKLIEEVGKLIGEDSLALKITGWYAPGANIHRSPYSGRNFEYYSEDGFLGGMIGASEVKGVRSKGALAYMKHFALNDQEINRYGGAIFANEQAIREIFLKSFEYIVRDGKVTGVMTSMNRLGATWSGAHYGLMTNTLRNEWGFAGVAITDQASVPAMLYQDIISGLYAGTDLWLNTNNSLWSLEDFTDNPTVMTNVRDAAHDIIYAIANSNAMNGISPDTKVVTIMPWWRKTLWAVACLTWLVNIAVIIRAILNRKNKSSKSVTNN